MSEVKIFSTLFDGTFIQKSVSQITGTPPESPSNGDLVVVGTSPTGEFVGHANEFALYTDEWNFYTPRNYQIFVLETTGALWIMKASAWGAM